MAGDASAPAQARPLSEGVWVYAERDRGRLHSVVGELVTEGRRLARELSCAVRVIALAGEGDDVVEQVARFGPDKIYLIDDPGPGGRDPESLSEVLCSLVEERRPRLLLIGATPSGSDLAARLSVRLGQGAVTHCVNLRIRRHGIEMIRALDRGRLHAAVVSLSGEPYIVTMEPGAVGSAQPRDGVTPEVVRLSCRVAEAPRSITFLGEQRIPWDLLDLGEAEVVVAGGRGMGGAQGFHMLEKLAEALNGAVGGTRVAADLDWIPRARQIGQTGRSIAPRLYVACGISGAIQHMAGLKGRPTVIAINSDPGAPIFEMADVAIVGDALEVVPALTEIVCQRNRERCAQTGCGSSSA